MENKFTFYVGLNDKDSKIQEISIIEAYKMVEKTINKYTDGCTIFEAKGIYKHQDGSVVYENTLRIEVLFINDEEAHAIVNEIKLKLNQESIAVSKELVISELW